MFEVNSRFDTVMLRSNVTEVYSDTEADSLKGLRTKSASDNLGNSEKYMNTQKFFIDGVWVDPDSNQRIDIFSPSTEETFSSISCGNVTDVDKAVFAARRACGEFSTTPVTERISLLKSVLEVYRRRMPDIGEVLIQEGGFPISLATGPQVKMGELQMEAMVDAAKKFAFNEQRGQTRVVKEAIGVCALITPWNWPLNQIACKVAPALVAGCTMVLKPSEEAPLNAMIFAEILEEAGVPPGVFNLINGDGETTGAALSSHPEVDMVSFTGSTRGGIAVARSAAETVKRVHQELGGKSPYVMMPDADIDTAVTEAVTGCYLNAGQSCNAPTRLLVPNERMDEVLAIAKRVAEEQTVGDPAKESTILGPVINEKQHAHVLRLIQSGIDEGAQLVCGGTDRPDGMTQGYYVRPTIFGGVTSNMTLFREEVFGPVLSVSGYRDIDHAVELANDTVYGLFGYVQGQDLDQARLVAGKIRAGTIFINSPEWDAYAPFGGYKMSGNGREYADFAINEFLEVKGLVGYGSSSN